MNKNRRRQGDEKVEIALEKSQATFVLVGLIVAMGAVFMLGVVFGSRTGGESDDVAAVTTEPDDRSGHAGAELTFHEALTVSEEARSPAAPEESLQEVDKPPTPVGEAEIAESGEASKEATAEPPKTDEVDTRDIAITAEFSGARDATESDRMRGEAAFTIQVASLQDEADARRLVERLRGAGWTARVVEADIDGRGRWYRVQAGSFDTRDEAMRRQARIQDEFGLAGLVVNKH